MHTVVAKAESEAKLNFGSVCMTPLGYDSSSRGFPSYLCALGALTLLVGRQEERLACKN